MKKKHIFLGYCGICGRDVETDYCYHCQRNVQSENTDMGNKKMKYVGGITECPKCGSNDLTTGGDLDKKTMKISKWYHQCEKCGHKIYFKVKK